MWLTDLIDKLLGNTLECPRCGKMNKPEADFCAECGNPLHIGAPLYGEARKARYKAQKKASEIWNKEISLRRREKQKQEEEQKKYQEWDESARQLGATDVDKKKGEDDKGIGEKVKEGAHEFQKPGELIFVRMLISIGLVLFLPLLVFHLGGFTGALKSEFSGLMFLGVDIAEFLDLMIFGILFFIALMAGLKWRKKSFWACVGWSIAVSILLAILLPICIVAAISIPSMVLGSQYNPGALPDFLCILSKTFSGDPSGITECNIRPDAQSEVEFTKEGVTEPLIVEFGREDVPLSAKMCKDEIYEIPITLTVDEDEVVDFIEVIEIKGILYTDYFYTDEECVTRYPDGKELDAADWAQMDQSGEGTCEGTKKKCCIEMDYMRCTDSGCVERCTDEDDGACKIYRGLPRVMTLESSHVPSSLDQTYLRVRVGVTYRYNSTGSGEIVIAKDYRNGVIAMNNGLPHGTRGSGPIDISVYPDPSRYILEDECDDEECTNVKLRIDMENSVKTGEAYINWVRIHRLSSSITDVEVECKEDDGDCCEPSWNPERRFSDDVDPWEAVSKELINKRSVRCTYDVKPTISVEEYNSIPFTFDTNYEYTIWERKSNIKQVDCDALEEEDL